MPYREGQPTLMGFLGLEPVMKMTKRGLFGKPYILFGGFLMTCSFLYEVGAVLGRARIDKLTILAKMFPVDPGKEDSLINGLQDVARERLKEYKKEFKKEPNSFYELFYVLELKRLGLSRGDTDLKTIAKACREKCSLKKVEDYIKMFGLEGIGFGSCFPELTEKMYRNYHESIDLDIWSKVRALGLDIPEKPDIVSLEEAEETALQMVAAYTAEYYPELLDALDLRGYIDTEGSR